MAIERSATFSDSSDEDDDDRRSPSCLSEDIEEEMSKCDLIENEDTLHEPIEEVVNYDDDVAGVR